MAARRYEISLRVLKNISIFFQHEKQKTLRFSEDHDKTSNSPVTVVTLKRFAVVFFLPSCRVIDIYWMRFLWYTELFKVEVSVISRA